MRKGHIYIASNSALKKGLLKIGLTKVDPKERISSLSKCTSIPDVFVLEYSKSVSDVNAAEIRMHMLLERFRYRKEKEFFDVNLGSAIELIKWISNYLDNHEYYCEYIGLQNDLKMDKYNRRVTLKESKLIDSTIAFSIGQTIDHHLFGYTDNIVSGFASALALSELFGVKVKSMMTTMRKFCTSCSDIQFVSQSGDTGKIFDQLYYHKGHMAWKYNYAFRPYVQNEKI
ncbi:GIY-YIG nuclease family protein [Gynuella sunshinyii]|uniref:RNA-binding protein Rrp4 and related protein (Containing S1 domain and KH domain) n=1 Tax=Gynuella sunshinyii YC6258 TaxID=1445510 RepID=A0A0C5VN99_9GAMM|nr:GIY-YIG nuclease family protein [Gynuella sunshinyii]AJQ95766.1 RNA-binding protein Rrp4 and related protein (containing S1 domain and KH domain) [Gynuella sunshinyii YC6258]